MIGDFLKEAIQIQETSGRDMDGKALTGDPIATFARVQEESEAKVVIDNHGKEVNFDCKIWVSAETAIDTGDIVTFESTAFIVVKVSRKKVKDGTIHHIQAFLRRTRES